MRQVKSVLGMLCSTALLVAATTAPANAQTYERVTKITFDTAVELPTMVLPAGTYQFRLTDPDSDRHVIEVLDENGATLVTRLHAMPTSRSETSDVTIVTFRETAANEPVAVRYWYYPNDRMGQEFAYPRERAIALADATGESVLSVDGDRVEPGATVQTEPVIEPAPVTEPVQAPVTEPVQEPVLTVQEPVEPMQTEPVVTDTTVGTSGRLPDTAGGLPLVALLGILALGGGLMVRARRTA